MLSRHITLGLAVLLAAAPVAAQDRGTLEFGVFGANTGFDDTIDLRSSGGIGLRFGGYLHPRLSLEMESTMGSAARPNGLADRSYRFIDARILAVPMVVGRAQFLLGAGVGHVDTHTQGALEGGESYAPHALVGAKVNIFSGAAIRLDGVQYFNGGEVGHRSIRLGLSLYRWPSSRTNTVYRTAAAAPVNAPMRADSVSAAETRRLRASEASYDRLRDSLARGTVASVSSAEALATMQEMINFDIDQATLSDTAKAILRDKVTVFRENPAMRIVIVGFTSAPGSADHNMALGLRRAESAKAYLVSQGVDPIRIEIATRGEGQLLVAGPGETANAENRRNQFRLLIADPFLAKPKP